MPTVLDPFLSLLQQGLSFQKEGQLKAAEEMYRQVVQQAPRHAMAWHLLGTVAGQQGRKWDAVSHLQQSLQLYPGDPTAWKNLASAFQDIGEYAHARSAAERALALRPDYHGARLVWATSSTALGMHSEAMTAFRLMSQSQFEADAVWPDFWRTAIALCDWSSAREAAQKVRHFLESGQMGMLSFDCLAFADDPALHQRSARATALKLRERHLGMAPLNPGYIAPVVAPGSERIRVAYLSADLHDHATAYLMAELFELHDRQLFEIIAVSFGPDSDSPMRHRLRNAFDQFWEVRACSDEEIVKRMIEAGVDIAVDLKGYTRDSRPSLFHHRPAPVIVSYLGYPGTMGTDLYDYVIGDTVVTPREKTAYYDEQVVQMPWCYQVNDTHRAIAQECPSRQALGLPEQGFVFAAFNNVYKITPDFFHAWMRLLMAVPGSVLWLISSNPEVQSNLCKEAASAGVDPARLVFAHSVPLPQHLARHAHADLLLDNLPYNAHTTTSDALWAGVPVVTCMGQAFAGRVAASLLHAVGLPELVTHSLPEYEALALRLATQPQELQRLRAHLKAVRSTAPLFDTERFTRQLESAYVHMHERRLQGLPPEGFAVPETLGAAMLPLRSVPPSLQPVPPLSS